MKQVQTTNDQNSERSHANVIKRNRTGSAITTAKTSTVSSMTNHQDVEKLMKDAVQQQMFENEMSNARKTIAENISMQSRKKNE